MKCQNLFSGKNKKNISKCRLLKILPRVLSVKVPITTAADDILKYIFFFFFFFFFLKNKIRPGISCSNSHEMSRLLLSEKVLKKIELCHLLQFCMML